MKILNNKVQAIKEKINTIEDFSGAVLVKEKSETIFEDAFGFADISNKLKNRINTRFGIASGAKILTGISICKLVDKGLLTFDTLLKDCIDVEFPNYDDNITIHQLLTHSSGMPDYFNEGVIEDDGALWVNTPMYLLRNPKSFVPLLQKGTMKFNPGEKFSYCNSGFVALGLVVEHVSGMSFTDFVKENIFDVIGMKDSGYFALDMLPEKCAYGYIEEADGTLKTNMYSIPIVGGPDGGVFVTVKDISKLWQGLFSYKLLSKEMTEKMLIPYIHVENDVYYGYGVWIIKREDGILKYYVTGGDPGVRFMSSCYPTSQVEVTVTANREFGPYDISMFVESIL